MLSNNVKSEALKRLMDAYDMANQYGKVWTKNNANLHPSKKEYVFAVPDFIMRIMSDVKGGSDWTEELISFFKRDAFFIGACVIMAIEEKEIPEAIFDNLTAKTVEWLRPLCGMLQVITIEPPTP